MALVNLTLDELSAVAQACRIAAVQAEADAVRQGGSSMRQIFDESAQRYRELATMFDDVRRAEAAQSGDSHQKPNSRHR